MGIGIGIGCEVPLGIVSEGGCCGVLGLRPLSVIVRLSMSSSSSIVGKYRWNSDTPGGLNGDAGVIFGESDVEDTGEGGPKLEAGIRVCGVDATGVGVDCIGVIIEVWRDNRLKGLAGVGEIGDSGSVACGSEDDDDDDVNCVVPLIPLVTSRETRFVEDTDNPAFCNEAIRPAIDFCPEELRQRNFVRMASEHKFQHMLTSRTTRLQSFRVPSAWIQHVESSR